MEAFIPFLFHALREGTPVRGVTRLPMKQAGLALPHLTKTASENWTASCVITGNLVAVLRGQEEFRTADHSDYIQEGSEEVRTQSILREEEALVDTIAGAPVQYARCLWRATKMEAWMTMQT